MGVGIMASAVVIVAGGPVALSTIGTPVHRSGGSGEASPASFNLGTLTVNAGDTAAYVGLTAAATSGSLYGSNALAAVVTLGGVTMTPVAASRVFGFGNDNVDGFSQFYELRAPTAGASQTIHVTLTWLGSATTVGTRCIVIPFTVNGALGTTTTGGHATSVNLQSSITAAMATMATGDLGMAIAANGSTAPGVTTGTSRGTKTGTTDSGSDNATLASNTGTGTVNAVFSTNNTDESQASWIIIPAA